MSNPTILAIVFAIGLLGFVLGRARAVRMAGAERLHSMPRYHGAFVAAWALLPALIVGVLGIILELHLLAVRLESLLAPHFEAGSQLNLALAQLRGAVTAGNIERLDGDVLRQAAEAYIAYGQQLRLALVVTVIAISLAGLFLALRRVAPRFRARNHAERIATIIMMVTSLVAILTTAGIVLSLLFEAMRFFGKVSILEFLFGLQWSPQTALRAGQVGASGAFGAVPLFVGTMLITLIAMIVAVPIGLLAAIYMSEYATPRLRGIAKPMLEILAGIPTVVYGFFAALTVAPMIRGFGASLGLDVSSESALAAGLVMGVMIIPFISSLSDDVMNAVPQSLRDGAFALGATKSETIRQVGWPAALPGLGGSVLLAVARASGETMIVVMAAGLAANLTINPLEAVTTVTVQMVTLLVGDQEFDSAKALAAFALGLLLFIITLILNIVAIKVVQRYRERYD